MEDPRTYDCKKGVRVVSDLTPLDVKRLLDNWVKYELKQRKKKTTDAPDNENHDDDDNLGIELTNWRSKVDLTKINIDKD